MAKKEKRFIISKNQGCDIATNYQIIVDKKTGVNYLWVKSGYCGGLTPLLDSHGNVVVTSQAELREMEE